MYSLQNTELNRRIFFNIKIFEFSPRNKMLDSIEIGMATIHLSVRIHIFKEFYNFFSGQCACLGINNIQQVRPCKK